VAAYANLFSTGQPGTTIGGTSLIANVDYNRYRTTSTFRDLASQVRQITIGNLPQTRTSATTASPAAPLQRASRRAALPDPQDRWRRIAAAYARLPQLTFSGSYGNLGGYPRHGRCRSEYCTTHTLVEGRPARRSIPDRSPPRSSPWGFFTQRSGCGLCSD